MKLCMVIATASSVRAMGLEHDKEGGRDRGAVFWLWYLQLGLQEGSAVAPPT